MRGFPPVQLFLLGLVFVGLAIPLVQLTNGYAASPVHAEDGGHEEHAHDGEQVVKGGTDHPEGDHKHVEVPTLVRLRFAHRPLTVSLLQEGAELADKLDLNASPVEFKTDLEVSHDGNELIISATWPEGTPDTALTLELEPDGFETRSETRWSTEAALNEVITFTW
ncbi:hypothetical protein EI77_02213 [Prosthecobacter fusiformis]|uniref:Uncharacterized protein n=1 Tax=Prosthecobacter fusiformis TaxID=48464 RepID=A0A4R7S1L4_9BACT|nr:hypothetical protein [Prosthecobacter fusiformis]TDU71095.1 hypothetical protein EI77_02213 [Prosthecobacter fusiformis]